MNSYKDEPLYKKESKEIVGVAMEVLNDVGHGLHEKPYENAMVIEFLDRGISCEQQKQFDILFKTRKVGEYVPDIIAYDKIIIDTKVIETITDHEIGKMMNYLSFTGLQLGYIINFKYSKLQWKRIIKQ